VLGLVFAGVFFFGRRRGQRRGAQGADGMVQQQPELVTQTGQMKRFMSSTQPHVAELPTAYNPSSQPHMLDEHSQSDFYPLPQELPTGRQ